MNSFDRQGIRSVTKGTLGQNYLGDQKTGAAAMKCNPLLLQALRYSQSRRT
jgi:hypothetical protein